MRNGFQIWKLCNEKRYMTRLTKIRYLAQRIGKSKTKDNISNSSIRSIGDDDNILA